MPKNYYIILGIPQDSTQTEVKSAYRRLAKEFHPDLHDSNHSQFQMINEAYSVLSDPARRRFYDHVLQQRHLGDRHGRAEPMDCGRQDEWLEPLVPERPISAVTSLDRPIHQYHSVFDSLFDRLLANLSEHGAADQVRLRNVEVEVMLTAEQARRGGNVQLNIPVRMRCPSCHLTGRSGLHGCWRCSGSGYLTGERPVVVSYPSGIRPNHTMRLALEPHGLADRYLTAIFTIVEER